MFSKTLPAAIAFLLGGQVALASPVTTITSNTVTTSVVGTAANSDADSITPTTIPSGAGVDSSLVGEKMKASAKVNYSANAGQTVLATDMSFRRSPEGGRASYAYVNAVLQFSVSEDTSFSLSGLLKVIDDLDGSGKPEAGRVEFRVKLFDLAQLTSSDWLGPAYASSYLVNSNDYTEDVSNQQFSLGSLSGSLLAGHDYAFRFMAGIQDYPGADFQHLDNVDTGAAADGQITLTIGSRATTQDPGAGDSLPEPGALSLVMLAGGLGLAASRRRRATR